MSESQFDSQVPSSAPSNMPSYTPPEPAWGRADPLPGNDQIPGHDASWPDPGTDGMQNTETSFTGMQNTGMSQPGTSPWQAFRKPMNRRTAPAGNTSGVSGIISAVLFVVVLIIILAMWNTGGFGSDPVFGNDPGIDLPMNGDPNVDGSMP